jgi:hypothetical protein
MVMLFIYGLVKLVGYSVWCYLGLRLFISSDALLKRAITLGIIRWIIGLIFGIVVFLLVGSIPSDEAAKIYFAIYTPLRLIEWGIMAVLIMRRRNFQQAAPSLTSLLLWIAGGTLVSFVTDLTSPEGLSGRFCIGRCLC